MEEKEIMEEKQEKQELIVKDFNEYGVNRVGKSTQQVFTSIKDPKKIFDNGNTTAILSYGKGCCSGETELEDALTRKRYTIEELYKSQKSILVNKL